MNNDRNNGTSWILIKILAGLFIFFCISMWVIDQSFSNIDNYDVQICYNTDDYQECVYGLTKFGAMRAAGAYAKNKNCVESRVEYIEGTYNVYFRTCNIFD